MCSWSGALPNRVYRSGVPFVLTVALAMAGHLGPAAATPVDGDPASAQSVEDRVGGESGRRIELRWRAVEPCPDGSAVEAAVIRFGGEPDRPGSPIFVDAEVRREGPVFVLDLELRSPSGSVKERHQAERCESLVDAVGLKAALALDSLAVVERIDAGLDAPPADAPDPEPVPATEPAAPALSSESKRRTVRGFLRPDGLVGLGILPGVGGGVSLAGGVALPHARFELGSRYWFPRVADDDVDPDVGVELQLVTGDFSACVVPVLGAVELPICANASLGAIRGEGVGVSQATPRWRFYGAAGVGTGAAWAVHPRVAIWIHAQLEIPFLRHSFGITGLGEVYALGRTGGRGALGVEFRFGG